MAHVAQSLAVEIGKRAKWSLTGCSAKQLAVLLDSRQFFTWDGDHLGYAIDESVSDLALPAAPDTSWALIEKIRRALPEPQLQPERPPVPCPAR